MKAIPKLVVSGVALFPLGALLGVSLCLLNSEQSLSRQEIQHIQRVLCSEPSGILDANTRQAIRRNQESLGLTSNAMLDGSQIRLLLGKEPCKPDRRSSYENSLSRAQILKVQQKLRTEPSGTLDERTRRALRHFQQQQGLKVRDGVLTPPLLQRLAQSSFIQLPPPEPLYGLGLPLSEGGSAWIRVNQLSAASRYPPGSRLRVTTVGVERRSLQVEVRGTFQDKNPRKVLQISRQAARLLNLGDRAEVAVRIEPAGD